jgi:thioredoxin reductase (NADPH)
MSDISTPASNPIAFPTLEKSELDHLRPLAEACEYEDGQTVFRAGDADLDLFVVEKGQIEIINPSDHNRHVVNHSAGQFAGDIDLLTRRPVVVTGVARGKTKLMRIASARLREILTKVPRLSEKLLTAALERRRLLTLAGVLGLKVVGPGKCRDTTLAREFLFKNFVPFTWYDTTSEEGQRLMKEWGSPKKTPVIECSAGNRLLNPTLRELAEGAGVWRHCPEKHVDLAIIGAGPAGMTAAVYAASEGLSTLVIDRLGPGGQAAGSSKIENFIGFPSGLSGAELAMRSVLQMLKFGAKIAAPVNVNSIEISKSPKDCHVLHLDCGTAIRAGTVLLAAGVAWRKLDVPGAERFEGSGIHHACTSVEAMLFDNLDVAVVGAGNSAGQAAMFLSECCASRRVHLLVRRRLGPGMSSYLVNRIRASQNIVVHEGVEVAAVGGERRLESVSLRKFDPDGDGKEKDGPTETVPLAAMFVFIGADPGCNWLPKSLARDKLGYILTGTEALQSGYWPLKDRQPCPLETSIPGVLAAGDIRSGSTKRVGFAVGDGSLAVTCVHKLIAIRT